MDIPGATGGLVEFKASLLASHGFAALALAYVGYDDLPSSPWPYVELDYIVEAAEWLYHHPMVLCGGIAVHSHSMGTWLALLLASFRTDLVKAVVAIAPWPFAFGSPHKYKGKLSNMFDYSRKSIKTTDEGIITRYCYPTFKEIINPSAELPAMIPVESITCPVLLGFGTDDMSFDSELSSGFIFDRMKAVGKGSLCTLLRLPGAGHLIDPPHSPLCYASYSVYFKTFVVWGGEAKAHALGQEIYWKKIKNFLRQNLLKNLKSNL